MTFLDAHAPDGLLAPVGLLGTSHRFLFKIGGRNTTTTTNTPARFAVVAPKRLHGALKVVFAKTCPPQF